ncbi:hypothetical protein OAN307_c15910 [Octadecabacter antarcticus 307]|uniref:Uncharacterized protein n=1 Tax=Octadecabacter antarcticus 307 TaxID=391626 RepID=M9R3N7_9RHOB|nr:hypothetical protein OAN307_c15910 [Octadecabacter antarcticus 307]
MIRVQTQPAVKISDRTGIFASPEIIPVHSASVRPRSDDKGGSQRGREGHQAGQNAKFCWKFHCVAPYGILFEFGFKIAQGFGLRALAVFLAQGIQQFLARRVREGFEGIFHRSLKVIN